MAAIAAPRIRPYRRYLISVLHRRFVNASLASLLVCYVVAILLGPYRSWIWSWFPLGPVGIRAVYLYICCLPVFIIRISRMRLGASTARTIHPSIPFWRIIFNYQTAQLFGFYLLSAFLFCEFSIFQTTKEDELTWVIYEPLRQRHRLNERPIWLRSYYYLLAFVQISWHIWFRYDDVIISSHRPSLQEADQRTHKPKSIPDRVKDDYPGLLWYSFIKAVAVVPCTVVLYTAFFRGFLWSSHMAFATLFFNIPRSNEHYQGYPPARPSLLIRAAISGFCLISVWDTVNLLFSAFLAQEPLKKNLPLSTESKDPNATLLSGLKAKKDVVRTFAFWELSLISQKFPERRKAIFADIDRAPKPMWTQMLEASLSIIKAVESRIRSSQPAPRSLSTASPQLTANSNSNVQTETLPRLAPDVQPPDNIFASSRGSPTTRKGIDPLIWLGTSPQWTPSAKELSKGVQEYASSKITELSKTSAESSTPWFLPGQLKDFAFWFLRSQAGGYFRYTFPEALSTMILSSPNAETALIVDAVESTTRVLVASLSEDLYGKVQNTVPNTVRTFTSTINAIDELIDNLAPHWTDVYFESTGAVVPEDVEIILLRLKTSLDELLSAFQLYLKEVGLNDADLIAARDAVRAKERKRQKPQQPAPQPGDREKNAPRNRREDRQQGGQGADQRRFPSSNQNGDAAPSSSSSSSSSSQPQRRKRLEERDRRSDLEFLRDAPPRQQQQQQPNGDNNEAQQRTRYRSPEMEEVRDRLSP